MSKVLRKTIMTRSKLKNICNKNRSFDNWDKYKKQRNLYVKLLHKTKQDYFNSSIVIESIRTLLFFFTKIFKE